MSDLPGKAVGAMPRMKLVYEPAELQKKLGLKQDVWDWLMSQEPPRKKNGRLDIGDFIRWVFQKSRDRQMGLRG